MRKRKIWLVDDDADDQLFFLDALGEINAEIECEIANNGQDALDKLKDSPIPELLFLDLNMPVMNGFDCLAELRKHDKYRDLPVVIFTTTSDLSTIKKTYELGANGFFKKPNDFPTMRKKLEALLEMDFTQKKTNPSFSFAEFSL